VGNSGFPGTSSSNKSAGVALRCEGTAGYKDIRISWRAQAASQASKYARLQYTTNGSTFVDFPTSVTLSGSFGTLSNNLAGIAVVNGQANFGFRIVTEFQSTATGAGQSRYVPVSGGTYTPGADMDFDMVTVYGQPVGAPATLYPLSYVAGNYFQLAVTGFRLARLT